MAEFSLTLNEDQLQIQKWVHDFAEDVVRPPPTSGTSARSSRGRSSQEAAKIGLYGFDFLTNAMGDPTGLTLPVAVEELFWGDAGIGLAIFGTGLAAAGIAGNGTPEQVDRVGPAVLRHGRRRQARRVLRERARRRLRRVVAAHPGRLRRGQRRVGAQRHQGVDHQRRHRRRPRGRRRRRPDAEGPRPGQLHRAARARRASARARSTRSTASGRRTPPRSCSTTCASPGACCSAARRSSTPSWPGPASGGHCRREAAGHGDVRGHPPDRRRPGPRHRPRRLRVRPRLRQGAHGVRQADHHEPGHRLQAGRHDHRDRRRPAADLAGRVAGPQRRLQERRGLDEQVQGQRGRRCG